MMRTWIRELVAGCGWHPSDNQLLAFHDNEILGRQRRRIMQHLNQCSECQDKSEQIASDWKNLAKLTCTVESDPVISEAELIARIQNSIHEWSSAHPPASGDSKTPESVVAEPHRWSASAAIRSLSRILRGRKRA